MLVLGDYLRIHVNFEPFWEKPPFFFWSQVIAMKIFGVGEYAARFPNAICGIVTVILIYQLGSTLFGRFFGALWGLTYFGSILPHIYFKSGLIDPWFNLFIFIGLYQFIIFTWRRKGEDVPAHNYSQWLFLTLSGLAIGMGILTKGPVALLVPGLCIAVYIVLKRFRFPASIPQFAYWLILTSLVTLAWYGIETWRNGPWFVNGFTDYQIHLLTEHSAGHAGFPGYHFVVNLFGVFPASIFALPALFVIKPLDPQKRNFRLWMLIFFWVVIILFSIVQSKIIHYSSLTYFPLTFLSALTIQEVYERRARLRNWLLITLGIVGGAMGLAIAAMPVVGMNVESILSGVDNPSAQRSVTVPVDWQYWQVLIGLLVIIGLVIFYVSRRRGHLIRGYVILLLLTALATNSAAIVFMPRILTYTQGPAIEFFESLQGKDCYATTLGYHSYAQYFYTRKQPQENPDHTERNWLLHGDIDKTTYFVTQKKDVDFYMSEQPELEKLGEKGRFVFLKRNARVTPGG